MRCGRIALLTCFGDGMAISRGRGNRMHSWFLLKDSVILVLVLCVLQLLQAYALSNLVTSAEILQAAIGGGASERRPTTISNADSNALNAVEREMAEFVETLLLSEHAVEATKEAAEEHASASNSISISQKHSRNSSRNSSSGSISNDSLSNVNNHNTNNTTTTPHKSTNTTRAPIDAHKSSDKRVGKPQSANESDTQVRSNITNIHNNTQRMLAVGAAATTSTASVADSKQIQRAVISIPEQIRENIVLSSVDPEKEAQLLYEQTLLEYHGSVQAAAAASSAPSAATADEPSAEDGGRTSLVEGATAERQPRTLHSVCEVWTQKHCHCTGTLERLSLSCRGIGVVAVPVELPDTVVTL